MNFRLFNTAGLEVVAEITSTLGEGASSKAYRVTIDGVTGTLRELLNDNGDAYELVRELAASNNELKGVFPNFERFRDKDNARYIFCADPELITFEEICRDAQQSDAGNKILHEIIETLKILTDIVYELHKVGVIHRDIKPSNFGVRTLGGKTLEQTIALFDVDTICRKEKSDGSVGTHGFMDYGKFDVQNELDDIYSIGACLYYALLGKTFQRIFAPENSAGWLEEIDNSKVIARCKNIHPTLKSLLAKILQRCLVIRSLRYGSCADLLKDLKRASYFSLPSKFDEINPQKLRSTIAMHWYRFNFLSRISGNLNVLIGGFGRWSQAFLDVAITLAQLPNIKPNVKVITDDSLSVEAYLNERPAIGDFFSIDGKTLDKETYGTIDFVKENFFNCMNLVRDFKPEVAFIALGEDQRNFDAAKIIADNANVCFVNYVWNDKESTPPLDSSLIKPVGIGNSVTDPLIEKMAYNVHLLWQKNLCIDFKSTQSEFKEPYNYFSCVLAAVHLLYKIQSAGIDTGTATPYELAANFAEFLENPNNEIQVNSLISAEHRRWVTEKISLGFRQRRLFECTDGYNKDKRKKTHTCLVRSLPNDNLENLSREQWDDESFHPKNLDELDRMSLELHRIYRRRAQVLKQTDILTSAEMYELKDFSTGNATAFSAFNEWLEVIRQLWHDDTRNVYRVERLQSDVIETLKTLPNKKRDEAVKKFLSFAQKFRLLIESAKYVNYKREDYKIVRYSPFILSFNTDVSICVPYSAKNLFSNVAAATVLNPCNIIFVAFVEDNNTFKNLMLNFRKNFHEINKYFDARNLRAKFEFYVVCKKTPDEHTKNWVKNTLKREFARVQKAEIITRQTFEKKLSGNNSSENPLFIEKTDLWPTDFSVQIPDYRFDHTAMTFDTSPLKWLFKGDVFFTVNDALTLAGSKIKNEGHIDIEDFKRAWKLFSANRKQWARFCNLLPKFETVATFKKKSSSADNEVSIKSFVFPAELRRVLEKIISVLGENAVITKAKVVALNADSCVAEFSAPEHVHIEIDEMLGKLPLLCPVEKIVFVNTKDSLQIGLDSLNVKIENAEQIDEPLKRFLPNLRENHCINSLKITDNQVFFTFASTSIKKLVKETSTISRAFVYHKAKYLGADDVATAVTLKIGIKEIFVDVIFTKGLKTTAVSFSNDKPEGWTPFIRYLKADAADFDALEKILSENLGH